jgi:CBS domain containing-hemolysin-like protein
MIHNVVDFRSVKVRDVMVAIPSVVTVRPDTTIEQLIELSRRSRFDGYPVVDRRGRIIGMVSIFDLLVDQSISTVRSSIRRILTVRQDDQASIVLRRLRAAPSSLAAVVDEQGNTTGIVSVEDLLNPLVKVAG